MATHFSILTWRIPWTEESGKLYSPWCCKELDMTPTFTFISQILLQRVIEKFIPGEENGYPLQYSCLENSMDTGAWRTTVYGVANSWT